MGLTCANIHVFTGDLQAGMPSADVGRAFDEACTRVGYERTESDSPAACDLVAVAAPSWVSVLDPRSPGILTEALTKLAAQLSEVAGCPVVAASVYDSDEFAFLVFEGGRQVDGYATQDDLLPLPFKTWSAKKRTQEWSRLFGRALDLKDVRELTQPPSLFADDLLGALCRLLGIPIEHGMLNPSDFAQPAGPTPRCYRLGSAATPGGGTRLGDATVAQLIPPDMEAKYRSGEASKRLPLMPGEETGYYVVLTGPAGAFSDPVLELFGPAIGQRLVEVSSAHCEWHCGKENELAGRTPWMEARVDVLHADDGERIARVHLPARPVEQQTFPPGAQTRLTIALRLEGFEEGAGELRARFRPTPEAAEPIVLSPVFGAEVAAPKWVPLRCESYIRGREQHPQLLPHRLRESCEGVRLLNTARILSGVAILKDGGDEQFAPIPGLLEQWLASRVPAQPCHVQMAYEGQMNPRTFHVPKKKQSFQPEEIGAAKKWQKLFARPSAIQSLFFQIACEATETLLAGASIQRTFEDDACNVEGTVHLAFWQRCEPDGESAEAGRDARRLLTSLIDSTFETMDGLQGWIACWDWVPRFSMAEENNYTPYEDAYAIGSPAAESDGSGGGYMDVKWCRRYLRGLSEPIWLGPPLLERIDRDRLTAIATVTSVGSSARFDLLPDIELHQLEELLVPILPISRE